MDHSLKHGNSSAGSYKRSCDVGVNNLKTSHLGGSNMSQHGGSHIFHHGGSHMSQHGGSHLSHHGGSHMSQHGGSHISHHGGSHTSQHGGSHMSQHGGSHMSHRGGSHMSQHGGSHMSQHGGSHMSQRGGSHMSQYGGLHMSKQGGSHMSQHGRSHMSQHGGSHISHHGLSAISHHGGSHMSHHGSHHISQHGGHNMPHHGGSHKTHHGGSHMSHHGESHMSHHGGSHTSHYGGHHISTNPGHHMSHHEGHHMPHHGGHHMSHNEGHHMSHQGGKHMSHHGGQHMSHHGGQHMSHHGGHHMSHNRGHHMSHNGGHHMPHHGDSHMSHHGGHHMSHHGGHHTSHHGSHHKKEVSFSKHVGHSCEGNFHSSGGNGGWMADALFGVNEKETMKLLNERLSSYLNKVRSLEMENAQLERNICDWYANNPPRTPPDGTQYFRIIEELQSQITEANMENARIVLQTDGARLAADDYRNKIEMENSLTSNADMDVNNLARVLDGLNEEGGELGTQVHHLQDEMDSLKNNSEEEINTLLAQLGARISVEMNAAPSIDFNEALSEIRDEYETLMEQNLKEAENMFIERSEDLNREVASGSEELQSVETELIEMKRCMQALEIQLQSELSLISALEGTLAETEATFGSKLAELQCLINNMESELTQIRSDQERLSNEYRILMDQKTHLEMEIATYKRLLEGHDINVSEHSMDHGKHGSHNSHRMVHLSSGSHGSKHLSHQSGGHHCVEHHSRGHHPSGHMMG